MENSVVEEQEMRRNDSSGFTNSGTILIDNEKISYSSINNLYDLGQSTLSSNINNIETTIPLTDGYDFSNSGFVKINNEVFSYTGKTGNNLTGVTRGSNFTNPILHNSTNNASNNIVNPIIFPLHGGNMFLTVPSSRFILGVFIFR